jgi:Ras-related GTP-binding protein C/D
LIEKAFLFDVVSKIYIATDSNPVDMQTYELCSDMIDVVIDVSCIYGFALALRSYFSLKCSLTSRFFFSMKDSGEGLAYDSESASVIRLSNGYVLYLRQVQKYLALVCIMREESFDKAGLVEYNIACFKSAIGELLEAKKRAAAPKATRSQAVPIKGK